MDQGPYMAKRAHALGLVDDLLFSDEVYDRIPSLLNMEKKHIKHIFLKVYLQKVPVISAYFGCRCRMLCVFVKLRLIYGSWAESKSSCYIYLLYSPWP